MNIGITVVVSSLILLFGKPLLGIFNSEPKIASVGIIRLFFILAPEAINAVMEIMSGSMRGYGYSLVPAIITFAGVCGIRITWVYTAFQISPTFLTLMIVYPVSWAITAAVLVIAYFLFMRRFKTKC